MTLRINYSGSYLFLRYRLSIFAVYANGYAVLPGSLF